jgi:hypothetical protein
LKGYVHRLTQLVLAVVIVLLSADFGLEVANAGHRHGNATCNSNPRNCRSTFVNDNWMYVHLHDQFSFTVCQAPQWGSQFDAGRIAWSSAPGPQILDWGYSAAVMTWHYLNCSFGAPVPAGTWGMNENCIAAAQPPCTVQPIARNTEWSVSWFDLQSMAALGPNNWKWMFVHEFGHALGLGDHFPLGDNAVMVNGQLWPNAPSAIDIGNVDCSTSGIRCIYIWWW